MLFSLANAPVTFQAYINRALASLVDMTCIAYIDNILIYLEDPVAHWQYMAKVLEYL